jgi:hypothetical protein
MRTFLGTILYVVRVVPIAMTIIRPSGRDDDFERFEYLEDGLSDLDVWYLIGTVFARTILI